MLWAYRTLTKTSNGETPFSLTYGSEAVIPAEIGCPSARVLMADKEENDYELRLNLDLLEDRRELAAIREAKYKSALERYYNQRVKVCKFKVGDYVFRNNEASNTEKQGKLAPNWEGPYKIQTILGKGAYALEKLDGTLVPRSWNAAQLRTCYI